MIVIYKVTRYLKFVFKYPRYKYQAFSCVSRKVSIIRSQGFRQCCRLANSVYPRKKSKNLVSKLICPSVSSTIHLKFMDVEHLYH